jgi:hypothetical protein
MKACDVLKIAHSKFKKTWSTAAPFKLLQCETGEFLFILLTNCRRSDDGIACCCNLWDHAGNPDNAQHRRLIGLDYICTWVETFQDGIPLEGIFIVALLVKQTGRRHIVLSWHRVVEVT